MNWLRTVALLIFTCTTIINTSLSQELNIGIHGSPIISIPVLDKINSNQHATIKTRNTNINAAGGLNINVRFGKICFETGATASTRSIVFRQKLDNYTYTSLTSSNSVSAQNTVRATGYAFSVPLQVGFQLDHHQERTTYDLFGLLGCSYESFTTTGFYYGSSGVSTGNMTSISKVNSIAPQSGQQSNWISIIAGFKINAVLRKIGLIEYGLRYHYPLSNAGLYNVSTLIANNTYAYTFSGDFYPRLSYLDFHLTYYFLNFRHGNGTQHYRLYQ